MVKNKILEQYNLEFKATKNGLDVCGHWLGNFLYTFRDKEDVGEFILDLDLAINDKFDQIEDPDWSGWLGFHYFAEIRHSEFAIWTEGTEETIIPLKDMRDILKCWKGFLES